MIGRLTQPTSVRIADRPGGAARIVDRAPERDQTEIEDEEHEDRGQARVPDPIGPPHRLAPERAGGEADEGESGAERRRGLLRRVGERMAPDERAKRSNRHDAIDEGRHPGRRHMQIHDLDRLALLIVGRGGEREDRARRRTKPPSPQRARAARGAKGRRTPSDWRDWPLKPPFSAGWGEGQCGAGAPEHRPGV